MHDRIEFPIDGAEFQRSDAHRQRVRGGEARGERHRPRDKHQDNPAHTNHAFPPNPAGAIVVVSGSASIYQRLDRQYHDGRRSCERIKPLDPYSGTVTLNRMLEYQAMR